MTKALWPAVLAGTLVVALAGPASARVAALQVSNESQLCVSVTIYVATDTQSPMYQLNYQKAKDLPPGTSAAFSAAKGRLAAMHLTVRAAQYASAKCGGPLRGVTQSDYLSPRAGLEVPLVHVVGFGRQIRVIMPGLPSNPTQR